MATTNDISSRIVDALYLSDPEIDTAIGTPLRKVIDAVSDQIAQNTVDGYLINYQYDIDTKTAGDLDDFCANFGIARLPGSRATGVVTFARYGDLSTSVLIGSGTQVVTTTLPQQTFMTTVSTIMDSGSASVDVPVQAVNEGPDSNIAADSPLQLVSTVAGVSDVSNAAGFTGGTIDETDDQLRTRFKATVFRNLAGTTAMYKGVALQTLANNAAGSFGVAQANIVGSSLHNVEQLQVQNGIATTSLTTANYFYGQSFFVTDSDGNTMVPLVNYSVSLDNASSPATFTITDTGQGNLPDGFYTVEYDYVPNASRNDPDGTRWEQGIVNNRVDIYVNGVNPTAASQTCIFSTNVAFDGTANSNLFHNKYVSLMGGKPAVGDYFIPLGFGPIIDFTLPVAPISNLPSSGQEILTIAGNQYYRGVDFDIVHRDDAFGYGAGSQYGIWWKTTSRDTTVPDPANNTAFPLSYTYNAVPYQVADDLANWRMVGTDVMVHAGKQVFLRFGFAIVYDIGANQTSVNTNINSALTTYLQSLGFHAGVQVSDVLNIVHNVTGVDNVRFLTTTESGGLGSYIESVHPDGTVITTYESNGQARDVYFDERSYPVFYGTHIIAKARNTFSA